jgi:sulfoquinovosidase
MASARTALLVTALLVAALAGSAMGMAPVRSVSYATGEEADETATAAGEALRIDLPDGTRLIVEHAPFRVVLHDPSGRQVISTVAGVEGAPVRVPGVDGPQPEEPLGALGGFPAIGFVVGADPSLTFPIAVPFFTGNRLFGAEAGALVSVVGVDAVEQAADGVVHLTLRTDAPNVSPATMTVKPLTTGGARLEVEPPPELPAISSMFTLASPDDEGLYGLGARKDAFDQRGLLRNLWVEQQNTSPGPFAPITDNDPTDTLGPTYTFPNGAQSVHFPQAVLFGGGGWAAWVRESVLQRVDLAASRASAVRWGIARPGFSLTLAAPGDMERASQAFTADNGRGPAPPRFAYEPWISVLNEGEGEAAPYGAGFDGGARVRADVEEIIANAEAHDLPIGVIGMEGWHTMPDIAGFAADLRARGYRLQAYWSPFINEQAPVFAEARDNGYLVSTPTGEPYPIVTTRGNANYLVDFTNPAAQEWWADLITWPLELGFEAFMNDFGELVTEGMVFHSGEPSEVVHNAYPVLYHEATRLGVDRFVAANPDTEPFFYLRAGFSGFGEHPGVTAFTPSAFPGDETTDWHRGFGLPSIVPMMLNLALGGSYAFTTDVGGYLDLVTPQTDAELFTRWHQAATFTPISREHNSTFSGSVRAWDFGEETLSTYRRYARAKVRLVDLIDSWAQRAARDGTVGPVRPLVLDDASPEARSVSDQWLLGTDILVAPVLEQDTTEREVYLPAGSDWQQVRIDEGGSFAPLADPQAGGRTITAPAPLTDIPIFVRSEPSAGGPADEARDGEDAAGDEAGEGEDAAVGDPGAPVPERALPATGSSGWLLVIGAALLTLLRTTRPGSDRRRSSGRR